MIPYPRFRLIASIFFLFLPGVPVSAREVISIELWHEIEPVAFTPEADNTQSEEEAFLNLFEEARRVFSGMIYGYAFTYIPSDKARGVREFFELASVAEIKPGDANLELVDRDVTEGRLYGRFVYHLEDFQARRRESWQTLLLPAEMGRGEGRAYGGLEEKKAARESAVREAIRNLLRPLTFNKPREIRGEVLLLDCPTTSLQAGVYLTAVRVKIHVKELIPYTIF